jgi:cytochrome c
MRKVLCSAFALSLVLSAASVAFAADSGADLYKAKCAGCHGADGTSKMPNVPPLGGADAQGKSDAPTIPERHDFHAALLVRKVFPNQSDPDANHQLDSSSLQP